MYYTHYKLLLLVTATIATEHFNYLNFFIFNQIGLYLILKVISIEQNSFENNYLDMQALKL